MEYFISDPHFGHANILKFERHEFKSIEEHDAFIVASINKVVTKFDTLYLLGDIGELENVTKLNGKKILIMGNHDKLAKYKYEEVFDEVYDTPVYLSKRIVLSHIPIPTTPGVLNVHGHLHGSILNSENHLNISAMLVNYRPISMKVLDIKMSRLTKDSHKFLYEWYAHLYKFVQKERNDVVFDEDGVIDLEASIELHSKLKVDNLNYVLECLEEKKDD